MDKQLRTLIYYGVSIALIAGLTALVRIPVMVGYIHPGDCAIALSAAVLGPYAAIPAALGSAAADMLGYSIYAPFTLMIKGVMGFLAGVAMNRKFGSSCLIIILAAIFMVGTYFLFDYLMFGGYAVYSLAGNAMQGAGFVVFGIICRKIDIIRRIKR